MPDIFGNPTAEEIRAAQLQQNLALQQSGNARARLTGLFNQAIQNVAPSPEVQRATRRERAIRQAQDVERRPDESSLSHEMRQLDAMFDRLKDVDPLTASRVAERRTALEKERLNRRVLTSQAEATEENITRRRFERERSDVFNNQGFVLDPRTGNLQSFDASQPGTRDEAVNALKAEDPNSLIFLTRAEAVAQLGKGQTDAAFKELFNKSAFSAQLSAIDNANAFAQTSEKTLNLLERNPDAFSLGGNLQSKANFLGSAITGIINGARTRQGDSINKNDVATALSERGVDIRGRQGSQAISLATNLAYVLARSLDDNGRLSDDDIARAATILATTNGDPGAISGIILGLNTEKANLLFENFDDLQNLGNPQDPQLRLMGRRINRLRTRIDRLTDKASQFVSEAELEDATDIENLRRTNFQEDAPERPDVLRRRDQIQEQNEAAANEDEDGFITTESGLRLRF